MTTAPATGPDVAAPTCDDVVVALGGNALWRAGDDGTVAMQYERARSELGQVADLIAQGTRVVLTHGNGPVVGGILLRNELARGVLPPPPLFIAGADSEGGIGLMLQQVLGELLRERDVSTTVASIVTQVTVSPSDPGLSRPTKPVGPWMPIDDARALAKAYGWTFTPETPRGVRRTVPSPAPVRIVESCAIRALLDAGVVPIACGGGGVPVSESATGRLSGLDAVIDKDLTAALLAQTLGVGFLIILMSEPHVSRGWGTDNPERIAALNAQDAEALAEQLEEGSVGPKLRAAARFARDGGETLICSGETLHDALAGRSGTRVSPVAQDL